MRADYDRQALKNGIVHLGVGAFHRAHQAVYTDAVLKQFGGDWGICGVSLRSPGVRDALAGNHNLYTVAVRSPGGTRLETIGALTRILVAPENPSAAVAAIADAAVAVVTLTITEKGYCLSPAGGQLDLSHPDISHDLADARAPKSARAPRSAIGLLSAALKQRQQQGSSGLTVISCDNLAGNGNKLRDAVLEFARTGDVSLAAWIVENCCFPNSMVDRIVPATTRADLQEIAAKIGHEDPAAVVTEPFSQWVIERNFAGPVPEWEQVGAQFVENVAPYERMKLRLLNASHSCMAYLGCLAGFRTVHDVISEPAFASLVRQLMAEEMAPTLTELKGFDLDAYQRSLIERFANPNLPHLTTQIAADGSQKIPERLLPAIAERLAAGQPMEAGTCGLAGWIYYTMGFDDQGVSHSVRDPMQELFARCYRTCGGDLEQYLDALLCVEEIFPPGLARSPELRGTLLNWLERFRARGALEAVRSKWGSGR